jgi:general secretion pathway protein K
VRSRRSRAGVALILALLVVTILTITVVPFVYDGRVEQAVAGNLYTSLQASYLAKGGVDVAEAVLQHDLRSDRLEEAAQGGGQQGNAMRDDLKEPWAQLAGVPIAIGGGGVSIVIQDELGKIPLNQVGRGTRQEQWRAVVRRLLMTVAEVDDAEAERLVSTLVDWVDGNQTPEPRGGAEKDVYLRKDPPYEPADAPLQTVAELRMIEGWTPKIVDAVTPFVTVYPPGGDRVNPNTAPRQVLLALVDQGDRAYDSRQDHGPFMGDGDFRSRAGATTANLPPLVYRSDYFSVTSSGGFRDSVYIVRAVLQRQENRQALRLYWRAE